MARYAWPGRRLGTDTKLCQILPDPEAENRTPSQALSDLAEEAAGGMVSQPG